ncbi:MAG: Rod shape-determining protein RodA [bacterium ADurb.Bin212]|nr:MAG: Rod shape-determining protein RodA [bacterium ADurb.Bin212]
MSKKIITIDYLLYLIPVLLIGVSVALIYSLVFSGDDIYLATKQAIFGAIGIGSMIIFSLLDYRALKGLWWVIYIITLLLLVYVDFFGVVVGGAMRWINLGFFNLQPSEVAKFSIIISMAWFFSDRLGRLKTKDIFYSILLLLPQIVLILKQPDLGTAIAVFFIYLAMLFAAKPSPRQSIVIISSLILLAAVFVLSSLNVQPFSPLMKQYQRERVLTFIDPGRDPYKQGYNVRQAQIAIGSGGLFGKGLGRGSQSQLEYLPMPHTDFIFSGAGESMGFFGASLIILMLLVLVLRIYNAGNISQDYFGYLVASGGAALIISQSVINIGMNLGIAPVTGIPLPFLSSGGSGVIIYFTIIGVIQSIYIRHKKLSFL